MKIILSAIILAALAIPRAGQSDDWKGKYQYVARLGATAGGSIVSVTYTVEILSGNASLGAVIRADGYQTDDTVRCDTRTEGNRIDLLFNSYPDGGETNQYGVQLYKKGDLLLSLEKVTDSKKARFEVRWGKYNTEVKRRVSFRKIG